MLVRGRCRDGVEIRLGLACGLVGKERDREVIRGHFTSNGWDFMDENWVKGRLKRLANESYENSIESIVVKMLTRRAV